MNNTINPNLISFFAKCNLNLDFLTVFWHDPMFLIAPSQTNLKDLFIEEDASRLIHIFEQSRNNKTALLSLPDMHLRNPKFTLTINLMSTEKSLFVFGANIEQLKDESHENNFNQILSQFMHIIRSSTDELNSDNQLLIRSQFEQVQKLNNELLNAQRQLKKLNALLKQSNETLNNRLVKDHLTGLVSRYQYKDEISQMIKNSPDSYGIFAFIDIDDFKLINDTYGHRVGDQYLITFSTRLKSISIENMICMRIAGDEFGIYIHPFDIETQQVDLIWEQIKQTIETPITIETLNLPIHCSVGVAVYNKDTSNIYELIDYADFAMYQAKESGKKSFKIFNKDDYTNAKLEIYKKDYRGKSQIQ